MKITIGPYRSWFGPYQLAEKLCFWAKEVEDEYGMKSKPDWVYNFGEWLAHGSVEPESEVGEVRSWDRERHHTWLYKFLIWIESKKKRRIKVHIDRWDTWGMDHTLALIILPMLKQLKAAQQGYHIVDCEDVPIHLRGDTYNDYDEQKCFDFYFEDVEKEDKPENAGVARWEWVLDEMIFAFDHLVDDSWEDKYRSGEHDIQWKKIEGGMSEMLHGPNDTYKCDYDGLQKEWARVDNGFRLFGKYYRGLWD